jgi:anti-sigma-K factor RskA
MIPNHLRDDAALYVLGLLHGADLLAFESELARSAELQSVVRELEIGSEIFLATELVTPPRELRTRILEAVSAPAAHSDPASGNDLETESKIIRPEIARDTTQRSILFPALSALAAAIAICFAIIQTNALRETQAKLAELSQSNATQTGELQKQVADLIAQNEQLKESGIDRIAAASLAPTKDSQIRDAQAIVVWNGNRGVLKSATLPLPPEGHDYQLWILDANTPIPVGVGLVKVRNVDPSRMEFSAPHPMPDAKGFAISIEPAGGSSQPQGPVVLVGTL